jgi:hypothetical protein
MPPDRQIALGPLLAAAGAVLLIVGLFFDWYGGLTAFTSFEVLDLVLLGLALAALLSLAERLGLRLLRAGIGPGAALPLGLLALGIVASQLINHPPAGIGRDPELGLWLSLGGAGLLAAGSLLSVARVSLAIDVERRRAGARSAAPAEDPIAREPRAEPPSGRRAVPPDPAEAPTVGEPPEGPGVEPRA